MSYEARDCREVEPHIVVPEWMTPEQVAAICELYKRSPDGSPNKVHFFHRVQQYHDYCGIPWCGMFVGIEKDGYTHSQTRGVRRRIPGEACGGFA